MTSQLAGGQRQLVHIKMALQTFQKKQLSLAGLLFALSILFFFIFNSEELEALDFYYDESEKKLFHAPATSIPPIKGINDVNLKLVWDPPWDKSMMSEAAKLELNL